MPFSPRAGKSSRVSVGGTALELAEAQVDDKGDDLDTVNFESGGFDDGTIGIEGCDISFRGAWNAARNYYDNPPGIFPRDNLATVRVFTNVADNVGWLFPLMRVLSARNGTVVRQLVTFEASGKSRGSFTRPIGSV